MGKNRNFISNALSGKQAKRLIKNCPNTNSSISCYLGIDNCSSYINNNMKHINVYIKKFQVIVFNHILFYTFGHVKRRLNDEKNNTKMQKFD